MFLRRSMTFNALQHLSEHLVDHHRLQLRPLPHAPHVRLPPRLPAPTAAGAAHRLTLRARVLFGLLALEGARLPLRLTGQQLARQQVALAVVAEEEEVILAVERLSTEMVYRNASNETKAAIRKGKSY